MRLERGMAVRGLGIALVLTSILVGTEARAIDGVDKAELIINGKSYVFPVGGQERDQDIYYLKRWLEAGDEVALRMFLGTASERDFFIGDDWSRWVKVHSNGQMEITDYGIETSTRTETSTETQS